jgi:cystathionine beta-lyase
MRGPRPRVRHTAGVSPLSPTDDRELLRRRGSLKWTGTRGDIAAWVAESDLGTAPEVTHALHDAIDRGLTGYLPPHERAGAARACADWQRRRFGWEVPVDRVRLVPDVIQALRVTVEHLTPAGSALVLPTPAYMPFVTLPAAWGREVIQVPMATDADGRATLDLAGIDAALAAGAGLVVLVNPHNPTGRVHTRDELEALAAVVEARGATVFADEIHAPLVHAGHQHVPYASLSPVAAAHCVTATAASKGWNVPGLKCAQVVLTSDAHAEAWQDASEGVSVLGAVAAMAAYDHGEPWLDETVVYLGENARHLAAALAAGAPKVGYRPPEGTYLAWLDLRAYGHDDPAERILTKGRAWVSPGHDYHPGLPGHVRLNLATSPERLTEVVRRMTVGLAD